MRKLIITSALGASLASPALAASGPFFSLRNTDFVVLLGFLLFLAVLAYFKVPGMLGKLLDKRADDIRNELDEARALREEAQTLLASYERKQHEVSAQADRIVANAKEEAEIAAVCAEALRGLLNSKGLEDRLVAAQQAQHGVPGHGINDLRLMIPSPNMEAMQLGDRPPSRQRNIPMHLNSDLSLEKRTNDGVLSPDVERK